MTTIHKALEQALGALEAIDRVELELEEYVNNNHTSLQQILDAALTEGRKALAEQAPSTAGERAGVVEDLLMYAGDNGYSHIDYADTMRHAAALLSAPALPVRDPWKDAVLDQLAAHAIDAPIDMPPADILKRVIDMAVTMATDPAIAAMPVGEAMQLADDFAAAAVNHYSAGESDKALWQKMVDARQALETKLMGVK